MTNDKINLPTEAEVRASFPAPPDFGTTIRIMPVADHEAGIARLTAELEETLASEEGAHMVIARLTAERDSAEAYAAVDRKMAQKTAADAVMWKARAEKAKAERDAALAGAVKVKPLVWPDFREGGTCGRPHHFQYFVTQDHHGRFWAHFDMSQHDNLDDAKRHCDRHYQRAALQPDPERRQADMAKAWMMARDMAAETADDCRRSAITAGMGMEPVLDAIRALTPPADLAAKIGGAE